jgi:hypothetical protein
MNNHAGRFSSLPNKKINGVFECLHQIAIALFLPWLFSRSHSRALRKSWFRSLPMLPRNVPTGRVSPGTFSASPRVPPFAVNTMPPGRSFGAPSWARPARARSRSSIVSTFLRNHHRRRGRGNGHHRVRSFPGLVFMMVEDPNGKMLYSNLSDPHAATVQCEIAYYRPILASLGIRLPEGIYRDVDKDQIDRVGTAM